MPVAVTVEVEVMVVDTTDDPASLDNEVGMRGELTAAVVVTKFKLLRGGVAPVTPLPEILEQEDSIIKL